MEGVMRRVQHIAGFLSGTMVHGDTWSFLRIGEFLERADMTTRIIDVRSVDMLEHDRRARAVQPVAVALGVAFAARAADLSARGAGADTTAARTAIPVQERRTCRARSPIAPSRIRSFAAVIAAQPETAYRDQSRHPLSRVGRSRDAERRRAARVHRRIASCDLAQLDSRNRPHLLPRPPARRAGTDRPVASRSWPRVRAGLSSTLPKRRA